MAELQTGAFIKLRCVGTNDESPAQIGCAGLDLGSPSTLHVPCQLGEDIIRVSLVRSLP